MRLRRRKEDDDEKIIENPIPLENRIHSYPKTPLELYYEEKRMNDFTKYSSLVPPGPECYMNKLAKCSHEKTSTSTTTSTTTTTTTKEELDSIIHDLSWILERMNKISKDLTVSYRCLDCGKKLE